MKSLSEFASICLVVYMIYLLRQWSSRLKERFFEDDEPWRESLRPDNEDE